MRSASFTAAAAIEMDALPMSVCVRTSLATANVRWNNRFSTSPSDPAASAERTACFIWPRICGSPNTIESSPLATRNAWVTARFCGSVYTYGWSEPCGRLWKPASQCATGSGSSPWK